MQKLTALLLIILVFLAAFWLAANVPLQTGQPGPVSAPDGQVMAPPVGAGPAAYLEYAYQLQTATAYPQIQATQQAHMTAQALDQRIFTDGLTATAVYMGTQQSLALTATPLAQTATAEAIHTQAAYVLTQQAITDQQRTQTASAHLAATSLVQTQTAPLIQAEVEATRARSLTQMLVLGVLAMAVGVGILILVVQYKEYLDDRQTKRRDESILKRTVPREGASPLFITQDERPIDADKAFFPDATQAAPSVDHQERVTQRAQAIQMAQAVAQALAAAPGTHTRNYLAGLTQLSAPTGAPSLPPEIKVLDAPPPYALDVESRAIAEGEGLE